MKKIAFAAAAALFLALPARAALSPAASSFLTELGFDPRAREIAAYAELNVNGRTLDAIASRRDEVGTRQFVGMRRFIDALRRDPGTPFPGADIYNPVFLTQDDKRIVGAALTRSYDAA